MRYQPITIHVGESLGYIGRERRQHPRIETPFPARVRSVAADAWRFEQNTILDNFSKQGLYLRLMQPVLQGIKLFVLIQLSIAGSANASAAYVAVHGKVIRTELRPGNAFGTAVMLIHHRFVYI